MPKEEVIPLDQRHFLNALKSMERRTMEKKIDLPTFNGKLEPDVAMDWIKSLSNFFECEDIPGHQKVKIAKSKLKGASLTCGTLSKRKERRTISQEGTKGESSSNNNGGYNQRGNFRGRRPPFRGRSQGRVPI